MTQNVGRDPIKEAMMSGCEKGVSRRTVLMAAAGAVPVLALMTSGRGEDGADRRKVSDEPKDGKQCDGCNFFVAPNCCKMVDGEISPTG